MTNKAKSLNLLNVSEVKVLLKFLLRLSTVDELADVCDYIPFESSAKADSISDDKIRY